MQGWGRTGADADRQRQEGMQAAGCACPEAQAAATSLCERTQGHRAVTQVQVQRRAVSLPAAQEGQSTQSVHEDLREVGSQRHIHSQPAL